MTAPERTRCPRCKQRRFQRLIGTGVVADGKLRRVANGYPYTSRSLPLQYNPDTGRRERVVVRSEAHEKEICAGALNGTQYERALEPSIEPQG